MTLTSKHKQGFTLIELLVVISIIGLLASIVLTSLTNARVKSRDTQRAEHLHQIQAAVELYASTNGHYPIPSNTWASFDSPTYTGATYTIINPNASGLTAALAPYIKNITDPRTASLGTDAGYLYTGDSNNYCILLWKTPENMNNFPKSMWPPSRCTTVDSSGKCVSGGVQTGAESIYVGAGSYAGGC